MNKQSKDAVKVFKIDGSNNRTATQVVIKKKDGSTVSASVFVKKTEDGYYYYGE